MKKLLIILFIVMVGVASCAKMRKKEIAKESGATSFQPKPLDDEWSKWIVGEWEVSGESDMGKFKNWAKGTGRAKIELGLNGQFLIMKSKGVAGEISPEYIQYLKETGKTTDEDIEKLKNLTFEEIDIQTIDPKTGQIIGYLFDSLRCIAEGRGRREGNKEIIKWKWFGTGQGASSIRITEKISDDKIIVTEKYILPDGIIMEDRGVMTRVKVTTEK